MNSIPFARTAEYAYLTDIWGDLNRSDGNVSAKFRRWIASCQYSRADLWFKVSARTANSVKLATFVERWLSMMWKHVPQQLPSTDPSGRFSNSELAWWSQRTCGIACCSAILERRLGMPIAMIDILIEAIETESYSSAGWIHQKLADILSRRGVRSIAASVPRVDIVSTLLTHDYICSVSLGFPTTGITLGGHLVACGGVSHDSIKIMDPSTDGAHRTTIASDSFFYSYSGRAVLVHPD